MGWIQDVTPNLDPYVYVSGELLYDWYGWCLATVVCAYSSPYSGPNAWSGWVDYTQIKHEDRDFPVGVYFPIWFSGYGGLGHVAFAYVNSQGSMNIWTSPFTHVPYFYTGYSDVDSLANGYGVTYVGWSEDIAGMRVIEYQDDQPSPTPVPADPIDTGAPQQDAPAPTSDPVQPVETTPVDPPTVTISTPTPPIVVTLPSSPSKPVAMPPKSTGVGFFQAIINFLKALLGIKN